MPSRRAAQVAIEQLDSARARFLGAVLNRVDLERSLDYAKRVLKLGLRAA